MEVSSQFVIMIIIFPFPILEPSFLMIFLLDILTDMRIRKFEETGPLRLMQRLPKPSEATEIPGIESDTEEDEIYQSAVFLQKIIKGRAIQTLVSIRR